MRRPRHWIRLWVAWLTTPAHLELSEGAFGLGPLLLLLCTWDGTYDGGGWLLAEDGSPMSDIALMRATHRRSRGSLHRQLNELVRCGTLKLREDGALGFPKFGRWQETKAAKYMRTKRARDRQLLDNSDRQTEDGRREKEQQQASLAGRRKTAANRAPKESIEVKRDVDAVLAALHDARIAVKPGLTRLRKRDHIRARLTDGATVEQLLAVIAYAADECRRKPEALQWLDTVTPFRPRNWESRLARAQAWQATSRATGPHLDLDAGALDRKRREAEEFDRLHRPWLVESPPEDSP